MKRQQASMLHASLSGYAERCNHLVTGLQGQRKQKLPIARNTSYNQGQLQSFESMDGQSTSYLLLHNIPTNFTVQNNICLFSSSSCGPGLSWVLSRVLQGYRLQTTCDLRLYSHLKFDSEKILFPVRMVFGNGSLQTPAKLVPASFQVMLEAVP